jgi:beta-lactamase class D
MTMRLITLVSLFLLTTAIHAKGEDSKLAAVFDGKANNTTIVIKSLHENETFVYNEERAAKRFSPASTFKIPNTLIAISEGVVKGGTHVFEWDGVKRSIPQWNHDQTLESAFKVSCVWCYQELARKVSADLYRKHIGALPYGELAESFNTTTFWLDGTLEISAQEQVGFLEKVYRRSYPFSSEAFDVLNEIMVVEHGEGFTLRAKTGWAGDVEPMVGWYVGCVEKQGKVWLFALNMEIQTAEQLPLRQELARDALKVVGAL